MCLGLSYTCLGCGQQCVLLCVVGPKQRHCLYGLGSLMVAWILCPTNIFPAPLRFLDVVHHSLRQMLDPCKLQSREFGQAFSLGNGRRRKKRERILGYRAYREIAVYARVSLYLVSATCGIQRRILLFTHGFFNFSQLVSPQPIKQQMAHAATVSPASSPRTFAV